MKSSRSICYVTFLECSQKAIVREPTIPSLQYLSNVYKVLPELLSKMSGEDTEQTPIKIDPENEQGEGSTVDPNLQS